MEIVAGEVVRNELSATAMGGSELQLLELSKRLDPKLLEQFQIIGSRVRDMRPDLYRIYQPTDLCDDPESEKALGNGKWRQFHKIVCLSNQQMQKFIDKYKIPWSHCHVMKYAIDPVTVADKSLDKIKLVYTPTPHRGLELLVPAFDELCKHHDDIELHVFSSFKLYGWADRDEHFRKLFDFMDAHPHIVNHGTVSNEEIRTFLGNQAHIFAYPSIWQETFCLSLLEAMSAGLTCVHSNLGCLFETAGNWTHMYQYDEDKGRHTNLFANILNQTINDVRSKNESLLALQSGQRQYVNLFYGWDDRVLEWNSLLSSIITANPEKKISSGETFSYRTN